MGRIEEGTRTELAPLFGSWDGRKQIHWAHLPGKLLLQLSCLKGRPREMGRWMLGTPISHPMQGRPMSS